MKKMTLKMAKWSMIIWKDFKISSIALEGQRISKQVLLKIPNYKIF